MYFYLLLLRRLATVISRNLAVSLSHHTSITPAPTTAKFDVSQDKQLLSLEQWVGMWSGEMVVNAGFNTISDSEVFLT